ncbi:uncharacterized protein LOC143021311 [Oratosquilla oratoria]|uniref:uncharacterized protein LOC143021311 n=1 Tax=Oratosquilla oratoria TaxID=337810 RepID=UPI003F762166
MNFARALLLAIVVLASVFSFAAPKAVPGRRYGGYGGFGGFRRPVVHRTFGGHGFGGHGFGGHGFGGHGFGGHGFGGHGFGGHGIGGGYGGYGGYGRGYGW